MLYIVSRINITNESFSFSSLSQVLTFSHFLPLTTLPFESTGKQGQAMGCEEIEEREKMLGDHIHIIHRISNHSICATY